MKRACLNLLIWALSALPLFAVPAKPGVLRHRQPDGTLVEFVIRGDEFGHLMMTTDGCALCWDEPARTLRYACYDASGRKHDTGVAVGASGEDAVRAASRMIPVRQIRRAAARRRAMSQLSFPHPLTRSESDVPQTRVIVLLAQFQDLAFQFGREVFVSLLNQEGYNYQGATGSAMDYFNAQFRGTREFVFDVGPIVTLSKNYAYYGEDESAESNVDLRATEAAAEACVLSDPEVDFSNYDFVYVFYAGGSPSDFGASDDHIWPHAWDFPSAGFRLWLDGKLLTRYAMSQELMNVGNETTQTLSFTGIGTFCHEFSHILGLPDLYDTDEEKSGGMAEAIWRSLSLMDAGNYNNNGRTPPGYTAIELDLLGLLDPEDLDVGTYLLEPMTTTRRALRLQTDTEGEYYLFECRTNSGWDRYIGGSGMLVYHVDRSGRDTGYSEESEVNLTALQRWEYNEINCRPDHQCLDLVEANPPASSVSDVFFPYGTPSLQDPEKNSTSFSSVTNPPFVFWSGEVSPYSLVGIRKSSNGVSFTVNGPISLDTEDIFQDAAIFNWHTDVESCKRLSTLVRCTSAAGDTLEFDVPPYQSGRYSLTLEDLTPGRAYTFTICYVIDGEEEYPFVLQFTTSRYGGLPYIHMGSSARRGGDTSMKNKIPLRVMNVQGATGVSWTLGGRSIAVGPDGYYEIRNAGTLKAVVDYADGTQDIIVREVRVR